MILEFFFKVCPKSGKIIGLNFKSRFMKYFFPVTGLLALAWYLLRVADKPSRAAYPCMQVAAPIASTFIGYLVSIVISVFGLGKARQYFKNNRYAIASLFIIVALSGLLVNIGLVYTNTIADTNGRFVPIDKPNSPIGEAKGIFPGRVAWAHNPKATSWDDTSNYWWNPEFTHQEIVSGMLANVLTTVAGDTNIVKAWDILFKDLNKKKGKGSVGYKSTEKIAVKVNLNCGGGTHGNKLDTSPQMVFALLDELVSQVGVPQENITLYDAQRAPIAAIQEHCSPKFPNVKYNQWGGWVADKLTFSSPEVIGSEVRRLPKAVVEAEYMVNMAVLKRHSNLVDKWTNGAGQTAVTLCGKNHFGTCGRPDALHVTIRDWYRGMGNYNPIVDLMASKYLGGNTVIYIIDGLYGGDYHNPVPKRWKILPFNNRYPSSVFASQDILAIESVGLDFLNAEWGLAANADNYLHEAAQAENPPSGIHYISDGQQVKCLGVHEHWNNSIDKKYSRNLKTGKGIELVDLGPH